MAIALEIPTKSSILRKQSSSPFHEALLCILVFQNLFNTFSPYLTLAINITVVISLLIRHQLRYIASAPVVIVSVYAVLAWMLLVATYRGDAETQILLKYFRVTVAVSLFALIFGNYRISALTFVKAINLALGFHVFLVMLQIAFPDLTHMTAPVFGFEREITILEQYTLRKLGASSSYDTASLLSIAALLFFYLQFKHGKGSSYLMLTTIAFVATLMSSRTGIVISLLVVTVLLLRAFLRARLIWKLVAAPCFAGFMVLVYILFYPLLIHTLGISEMQSDEASLFFSIADYGTTGTVDALTGDHLKPLDQPLLDLLIGFAVDPNTIGMPTDIGYVKFIYHVGIVGTMVILFVHLYMLEVARTFVPAYAKDTDSVIIARFLFVLIALSLAFNYKSLELHSRGIGDFIYIVFLFLVSWRGTRNRFHTRVRSN